MSKITAPSSFGETSVILQEAMVSLLGVRASSTVSLSRRTRSLLQRIANWASFVLSECQVDLQLDANATPFCIRIDLSEVTRQLLLQTTQRTDATLSKEDIQREYVNQETRKEWADRKSGIVNDVLAKKNIRSGQGKWKHSLSSANHHLSKSSLH